MPSSRRPIPEPQAISYQLHTTRTLETVYLHQPRRVMAHNFGSDLQPPSALPPVIGLRRILGSGRGNSIHQSFLSWANEYAS